jgi:hypothetical protein
MKHDYFKKLEDAHEKREFPAFIRDTAASGELFNVLPHFDGLDQVPQDPRWHPEGDVWTHTLLVLENLPSNASFAMSLSDLFHDIGKAATTVIQECGRITAYGHEGVSAKIALEILDLLGADEELKNDVSFIVRHHMTAHCKDANKRTLRRLIREGGRELVDQLLQHGVADVASGCRDFTDCQRLREIFNQLDQ